MQYVGGRGGENDCEHSLIFASIPRICTQSWSCRSWYLGLMEHDMDEFLTVATRSISFNDVFCYSKLANNERSGERC